MREVRRSNRRWSRSSLKDEIFLRPIWVVAAFLGFECGRLTKSWRCQLSECFAVLWKVRKSISAVVALESCGRTWVVEELGGEKSDRGIQPRHM